MLVQAVGLAGVVVVVVVGSEVVMGAGAGEGAGEHQGEQEAGAAAEEGEEAGGKRTHEQSIIALGITAAVLGTQYLYTCQMLLDQSFQLVQHTSLPHSSWGSLSMCSLVELIGWLPLPKSCYRVARPYIA